MKKFTETLYLLIMALAASLLPICLSSSLKNFWPEEGIILDYYGYFLGLMVLGSFAFHHLCLWEKRERRIVSYAYGKAILELPCWSTLLIRISLAICIFLAIVCLANLFPGFSGYLATKHEILDQIVGWPLFISLIVLVILSFGGVFARELLYDE